MGLAALAVLGLLAFLLLRVSLGGEDKRAETAPDARTQPTADAAPLARAVSDPDRAAVRSAYAEVARLYQAEQVSGLTAAGQRCFAALGAASSTRDLDYCLAFDAFGAAFAQREAGAPAPPQSYFGQTESRALRAGELVLAGDGDPSGRLVQIRQLALEVAREGAPAYAQVEPPRADPPASEPAPGDDRAAGPPPADSAAPPVGPPPARVQPPLPIPTPVPVERRRAERLPPRRTAPGDVDREAFVAAGRDAGPTAAEVAAARPRAGRGPSFNCRFARSASERLVCDDPGLAALDRRLNAAYEDAIAAGVPRRVLRADQDHWLITREQAAPDPDAVEDAYRRRIEELGGLR